MIKESTNSFRPKVLDVHENYCETRPDLEMAL